MKKHPKEEGQESHPDLAFPNSNLLRESATQIRLIPLRDVTGVPLTLSRVPSRTSKMNQLEAPLTRSNQVSTLHPYLV